MPKIKSYEEQILEELQDRRRWQRSQRGNFYMLDQGSRLTVFQLGGSYRWCLTRGEGKPRFSRTEYASEDEAVGAVCLEHALDNYV